MQNYGGLSEAELNGAIVTIRVKTANSISQKAPFILITAGSYICSKTDTLKI